MKEMGEMQIRSLSWEDPLEKKMAPHSSVLSWKIPWTEGTSRLQSMGLQRLRHDWATEHSNDWGGLSFQVLDSCIARHIYVFFRFSSHISYYGMLRRVPCVMQCVLDDFMKSSVCMLIWTSSFLPALLLSSLGTVSFFLGTISLWGHFSLVKKFIRLHF